MGKMVQRPLIKEIAMRVKEERYRRGWSASELSAKVEAVGATFPRAVLANLENERRDSFDVTELVAIAEVFAWTLDWLIYGVGMACVFCHDEPPAGYTCQTCGKDSEDDVLE